MDTKVWCWLQRNQMHKAQEKREWMQKPTRWPQINDTSEAQKQGNKNNGIISNAKHQPR